MAVRAATAKLFASLTPMDRAAIYSTDRSFGETANKWGQQIALDTFFNVTKEFWPDVRNKLFRH